MTFLFSMCSNGQDPELETPDIDANGMSHGTNLTQLGCFVYLPWQYDLRPNNDGRYNVRVISGDSEIYSKAFTYTHQEADLVIKLYKDKTLKYWLKKDYIHSPIDTTSDSGTIIHGVSIDNSNIKNIYKGSWTFSLRDSAFKLIFSDPKMMLASIDGKYMKLGSSAMSYQKISFFDSTINGRLMTLKKNHYKILYSLNKPLHNIGFGVSS